ncbi:MAG TPA: DUF3617 family protein [Candidatus Aquilonibacter sp.]|nr:DUF3617 family protein [Candidatus Aquilonibacter sp.]
MVWKFLLSAPLVLAVSAVPPAPTSGPPPIKLGLWETTMSGGMMGANSFKARVCVTADSYQNAFARMPPGCTVSNQTRTATHASADIACTMNNAQSSGHFEVDFPDPETSHSTVTLNMTVQGQTMPMTIKTDGKFISSDCGSVVPGKPQIIH